MEETGNYSILNPWYEKFYNIVETGDENAAMDFYRESFPLDNDSDWLLNAGGYICSRLIHDLEITPLRITMFQEDDQGVLDSMIRIICTSQYCKRDGSRFKKLFPEVDTIAITRRTLTST